MRENRGTIVEIKGLTMGSQKKLSVNDFIEDIAKRRKRRNNICIRYKCSDSKQAVKQIELREFYRKN